MVFILQSIKPRVETKQPKKASFLPMVFILQSIKPRVETRVCKSGTTKSELVFILQSIKPRVETIFQADHVQA